jgi:hypothetical protein
MSESGGGRPGVRRPLRCCHCFQAPLGMTIGQGTQQPIAKCEIQPRVLYIIEHTQRHTQRHTQVTLHTQVAPVTHTAHTAAETRLIPQNKHRKAHTG